MPHEFLAGSWQGFTSMAVGFGSALVTLTVLMIGLRHEKKFQAANKEEHH